MSSLDTVFCNFFVAKPRFWREWLSQVRAHIRAGGAGGDAARPSAEPCRHLRNGHRSGKGVHHRSAWHRCCCGRRSSGRWNASIPSLLPQASAQLLQVAGGPGPDGARCAEDRLHEERHRALPGAVSTFPRPDRPAREPRARRGYGAGLGGAQGPAAPSGPSDDSTPWSFPVRPRDQGRQQRSAGAIRPAPSCRGHSPRSGLRARRSRPPRRQASRSPAHSTPWKAIRKPSPWPAGSIGTSSRPTCRTRTWLTLLPGRKYDFIVLADVIEHLEAPGRLLRRLPACSRRKGAC